MTEANMTFMPATIQMPYTLTAGRAMGTFLAELANRRIVGSRCSQCSLTRVPAQDYCPECGSDAQELVVVPESGELVGFTQTSEGVIALVRLDGTHVPLLHRLVDVNVDEVTVGDRVLAVWSSEPSATILGLHGFITQPSSAKGELQSAGDVAEPIAQLDYTMTLEFEHAYGHFYGTLFDGIATDRRLRGIRCPSCRNVLLPPRAVCEKCYVATSDWVDVPDTGVVQACSVVHIEFQGQRVPPPYVYAEIILDGTSTRLIHTVAGLSAEGARAGMVKPGSRVVAVWSDRRTGSLSDIDYFRVLEP